MPSGQVDLQNWCISKLDTLLCHYGEDRSHGSFKLPPLVDQTPCKREFLAFKLQDIMKWGDKNLRDLWGMIIWNHALQARCPNLLILAELAHVQYDSTPTCEHAFSVQNLIKTKVRNRLGSKNLDAMLRITLEGPDEEVDDIPLWKKDNKYHFLYANPSSYLNSSNTVSANDVSCSFGAIDTNGNGTQFHDFSILTSLRIILGPFCGACIFRRLNP
jgi:hypothetical protein